MLTWEICLCIFDLNCINRFLCNSNLSGTNFTPFLRNQIVIWNVMSHFMCSVNLKHNFYYDIIWAFRMILPLLHITLTPSIISLDFEILFCRNISMKTHDIFINNLCFCYVFNLLNEFDCFSFISFLQINTTLFKCTWKKCNVIHQTVDEIETHVREIHLG